MTYYAISNFTIQLKDNDKKEREKTNQLTAADLKDNLHLHYVKMHDHCIYKCFFDVHIFSLLFFLISCTHYLCKYNICHKKIFNIFIIIGFKNQCVGANKCLRSRLQFRSLTSVALKNSQEKQLLLKSAAIQVY